jgi:surface antigen
MKKTIITMALAVALIAPAGAKADGEYTLFGTLGGAALGGFLGSKIGSGKGQLAATGAGVLLGGFIGHQIGKSLDSRDRSAMAYTQRQALETAPSNQPVAWRNPDSGNSGYTVPQAAYQNTSGQYCREFNQTVNVGGQSESAYGTACRQPDGTWKIVN